MGFWKFVQEGGLKTLEIRAGGGLNLEKSSAGVSSTESSRDSHDLLDVIVHIFYYE